ncbi:peptidase U32 family protein [Desulforhopalus singaporensis]|uniref:Putative protease n=1 Tax=Desulforhopalus singaporensis TaxID=91360 RepID=A0A1H0TT98_9BACT|nr:U32 family peptidase [Desulforhopalus singaporensis]SDP57163.1 putative protease [Desulforhopalus singaporensis]
MESGTTELLAPAKNLSCGVAAIDHGADAVYIGGPQFGARAAACNSLDDIERLIRYAHVFGARVYVALNTLFSDRELEQAAGLCRRYHEMGADALIIQDLGLLETELPPMSLHASTQMNNRTPEKVRFLEKIGMQQVVLARELSLGEIAKIRQATTVALEFFVHGALCVSYSGQCYISEVMAGRSANRGECAQFCRHSYTLSDRCRNILLKDKYPLSLKDLNLSSHLAQLLDAGISSFKIEGRLKDEGYVKNVTAYYRRQLDTLLEHGGSHGRSSSGTCFYTFTPDPEKSFYRGATSYYLTKRKNRPAEIRTPKATGKFLGRLQRVERSFMTIDTREKINNGDGLCFFGRDGALRGIRVNRAESNKVYPKEGWDRSQLVLGTKIYRNLDAEFNKLLRNSHNCRKIAVSLELTEQAQGLLLTVTDEDGVVSRSSVAMQKERARKTGGVAQVAARQLEKSGESVFMVKSVGVKVSEELFCPVSILNKLRRDALEKHMAARLAHYVVEHHPHILGNDPLPDENLSYLDNITNSYAERFYRRHGAKLSPGGYRELLVERADNPLLMITRYCLRGQLGLCPRLQTPAGGAAEPLVLSDNSGRYELVFFCDTCEMGLKRLEEKQR